MTAKKTFYVRHALLNRVLEDFAEIFATLSTKMLENQNNKIFCLQHKEGIGIVGVVSGFYFGYEIVFYQELVLYSSHY